MKKIYNEKQKERYLDYRKQTSDEVIPLLRSVFKKTGSLEELYHKDISLFNREQIEDLLYYLGLGTVASLAFVYYSLIDYVDWCLVNGLVFDGINHLREIEYANLGNYINKKLSSTKIFSRDEILRQIGYLNNPRDQVFLLSCFEFGVGTGYHDFLNMEMRDVDRENHILHLVSRDVKVSEEWISIAEESANTFEIYTNVHDFDKPNVRKIKLEGSSKIFKNTINTSNTSSVDDKMFVQKRMARIFASIKKTLGLAPNVKAQAIINSGRIYYVNTNAKVLGISSEEFIRKHRAEIENQFGVLCNPLIFIREYGDYLD